MDCISKIKKRRKSQHNLYQKLNLACFTNEILSITAYTAAYRYYITYIRFSLIPYLYISVLVGWKR